MSDEKSSDVDFLMSMGMAYSLSGHLSHCSGWSGAIAKEASREPNRKEFGRLKIGTLPRAGKGNLFGRACSYKAAGNFDTDEETRESLN